MANTRTILSIRFALEISKFHLISKSICLLGGQAKRRDPSANGEPISRHTGGEIGDFRLTVTRGFIIGGRRVDFQP